MLLGGRTQRFVTLEQLARSLQLPVEAVRAWTTHPQFPPAQLTPQGVLYRRADLHLLRALAARFEAGDPELRLHPTEGVAHATPSVGSVFAVVARASGTSLLTRKPTLVAFSHVIEEECHRDGLAGAHLFGAFQRQQFYDAADDVWTALSAEARSTHVFVAPTGEDQRLDRRPGPSRVHLTPDHPLRAEWAVVVDRDSGGVAFSARERPGQVGVADRDRLFDSTWTTDPGTVRRAARTCAAVALAHGVASASDPARELAAPWSGTLMRPALADRVLDRLLDRVSS